MLQHIYDYHGLQDIEDKERHVALLYDEIKIKAGIAFSKRTGRMIGFCDIGDIQNELAEFERRLNQSTESPTAERDSKRARDIGESIATHVLVLRKKKKEEKNKNCLHIYVRSSFLQH